MALGLAPAMPVGARRVGSARSSRATPEGLLDPLSRTLVLAAALIGIGEVILNRVAVPVISHMPGPSHALGLVDGMRGAGEVMMAATAALLPLAAASFAFRAWRERPILAGLIAAAAGSTVAAALLSSGAGTANHILIIGAVVVAGAGVVGAVSGWHAAAVGLVGVGVVVGQLPLLLESLSTRGGAAADDLILVLRGLGEMSLVLAPLGFAIALIRSQSQPPAAWYSAVAAGLIAAIAISAGPDYAAIMSLWAVGATLSLPPVLYVVSAGCVGFLLGSWLRHASTRHLAAGLVLLAVAGVQPAIVHHNLTALVAVLLLAMPLRRADAVPAAGREVGVAADTSEMEASCQR